MNEFLITLGAGFAGYLLTRRFVSRRLRFVDAVQSRFAPLVAAVFGALAILPLTALPTRNYHDCNGFWHRRRLRYRQCGSPRPTSRHGAEATASLTPN